MAAMGGGAMAPGAASQGVLVRPGSGLLAWGGSCEFGGPVNYGSNYELGQEVNVAVVVGGAPDARSIGSELVRSAIRRRRSIGCDLGWSAKNVYSTEV